MSADGKLILAGGGSVVHVWRFATGEHLKDIEVGGDVVNTLVLKPDNRTLVVGSQDCKIRVADVEEGKLLRTIDGRMWLARSLAVSPDFKNVALGAVYPTIRQFDLQTGNETHPALTAAGHDAPVRCVAWSPDGKRIVSGGENKHVHVWDPATGQHVIRISPDASASSLVFTPSGEFVLTAWEWAPTIRVREAATGKEVKTLDTGMSAVRSLTLTPDGKQVIAVGSKKTAENKGRNGPEAIQFWDIESGAKLRELPGPSNRTGAITFAAGGSLLIAGDGEGAVHVLTTETGKEIATLLGHQHSVRSLALSPDGKLLASGSTDQTIRFWDTETWKAVRVLQDQHSINCVAFSPDGRLLASGSGQVSYPIHPGIPTRIRLWNVDTGKERAAFTGHDSYTQAVAFSPDGRRLVSGHDNTTLLIWDVTPHLERAGNER
jgi:WD40 repeat protein